MSATEPSSTADARSWSGWSCHESGGFPPCNRVCSACWALLPPPPDTAALTTWSFESDLNFVNSTSSAFDSDPEVHHEKTSSLPVPPHAVAVRLTASATAARVIERFALIPVSLCPVTARGGGRAAPAHQGRIGAYGALAGCCPGAP